MHWASRINGELLDGKDVHLVWKSILDRFQPRGINFLEIGEGGVDWMVITQYTSFRDYRGMHSSQIPQFEEGPKDIVARRILYEGML